LANEGKTRANEALEGPDSTSGTNRLTPCRVYRRGSGDTPDCHVQKTIRYQRLEVIDIPERFKHLSTFGIHVIPEHALGCQLRVNGCGEVTHPK
jgi:hypothetical protein